MLQILGYAPLENGQVNYAGTVEARPRDFTPETWIVLHTLVPDPSVSGHPRTEDLPYPHNDGLGVMASIEMESLLAQLVEEAFEAGNAEEPYIDYDMIGAPLAKRILALYRDRLPRRPPSILPELQAVCLPSATSSSLDDLSSPFWKLVQTLMPCLPESFDQVGQRDRRLAVANVLINLPQHTQNPPYPLVEYAERYAYLRETHWTESPLSVVVDVPSKVQLLGRDCPSGNRLDEIIDGHRAKKA